jgi:hypothetical protein
MKAENEPLRVEQEPEDVAEADATSDTTGFQGEFQPEMENPSQGQVEAPLPEELPSSVINRSHRRYAQGEARRMWPRCRADGGTPKEHRQAAAAIHSSADAGTNGSWYGAAWAGWRNR